jgi:hypothetical protein
MEPQLPRRTTISSCRLQTKGTNARR